MSVNMQMSNYQDGSVKTMVGVAATLGQEVRQSEIEREIHNLLRTAEQLENVVDKAVRTVEKVTSDEPEGPGQVRIAVPAPNLTTMLGRDLDGINSRIQSSMAILQSTIQRIEL